MVAWAFFANVVSPLAAVAEWNKDWTAKNKIVVNAQASSAAVADVPDGARLGRQQEGRCQRQRQGLSPSTARGRRGTDRLTVRTRKGAWGGGQGRVHALKMQESLPRRNATSRSMTYRFLWVSDLKRRLTCCVGTARRPRTGRAPLGQALGCSQVRRSPERGYQSGLSRPEHHAAQPGGQRAQVHARRRPGDAPGRRQRGRDRPGPPAPAVPAVLHHQAARDRARAVRHPADRRGARRGAARQRTAAGTPSSVVARGRSPTRRPPR